MDPITGIGLVLGLAPLFSICLEYFEYFKTAQSLSRDLEILLLKLDFEHEKFLVWGETNGISKTVGEGRNLELDVPAKSRLVKRGLEAIQSLFGNGRKLQEQYGLRASESLDGKGIKQKLLSSSSLNRFRRSYKELQSRTGEQSQPGVVLKTTWAIHDKAKFVGLISDIKDLVDDLYKLIPVTNKARDKIIFRDIRALLPDLKTLKLVEKASEETYPTWSETASLMILASESGTIGGSGSTGQWLDDFDGTVDNDLWPSSNKGSDSAFLRFDIPNSRSQTHRIYFVFTSACLSAYFGSKCHEETLGTMIISEDGPNYLPEEGFKTTWALGKRITKAINPSFSEEMLELIRQVNYDYPDIQKLALESALPLETVDIFCAPCACAIQTALRICAVESTTLIKYTVKVDDRFSVSCCTESAKFHRLAALLTMIQQYETGILTERVGLSTNWIQYIDRVWIEQRIYRLETQLYTHEEYANEKWSVADLLQSMPSKNAVILGEIENCLWVLQTKPFPWTPRMPKENEIYELRLIKKIWRKQFLGSFTPRNFGAIASSPRSTVLHFNSYQGASNHVPPPQAPEMKTTSSNTSRLFPPTGARSGPPEPFSPAVDTLGSSAVGDDHILGEGGDVMET